MEYGSDAPKTTEPEAEVTNKAILKTEKMMKRLNKNGTKIMKSEEKFNFLNEI